MRRAILFLIGLALIADAWIFCGAWCIWCAFTMEPNP